MSPRPTSADERIAEERARATALVRSLTRELDEITESGSMTNTDDEHDPDGSTIAYERAKAAALLAAARTRLDELDHAEAQQRAGTYGRCRSCGAAISPERLDALPATTTCVTCAAAVG